MSALVFAAKNGRFTESQLNTLLAQQFDDFDLVLINPTEHTIYREANEVVYLAKTHDGPVFVIVDEKQPEFAVVVAAKLSRIVWSFFMMKWIGNRFRVLRVP